MKLNYLPVEKRRYDQQYRNALTEILERGMYNKNPFQTTGAITHLTLPPLSFKLSNGFPIITERRVNFWRKPIAELLAFIHGARTGEELRKWGVNWWGDQWATPEKCAKFGLPAGDLGPGSYGAAFHDFPAYSLENDFPASVVDRVVLTPFNQFKHLIAQIKAYPSLRTHMISPWVPQYCLQQEGKERKVVVAPCHGWIHISVIEGKLFLRMNQRSADFPIGVPANLIQYAALTIMIAHVTGNEPFMYIHSAEDAHIYENQKYFVGMMLSRPAFHPFPTLLLTKDGEQVTDLFDFRPDHFELHDYQSHPAISDIPVTV